MQQHGAQVSGLRVDAERGHGRRPLPGSRSRTAGGAVRDAAKAVIGRRPPAGGVAGSPRSPALGAGCDGDGGGPLDGERHRYQRQDGRLRCALSGPARAEPSTGTARRRGRLAIRTPCGLAQRGTADRWSADCRGPTRVAGPATRIHGANGGRDRARAGLPFPGSQLPAGSSAVRSGSVQSVHRAPVAST